MINNSISGSLSEEMIDAILGDSFPASDPPSWTLGRENQSCSGCADDSPIMPLKMDILAIPRNHKHCWGVYHIRASDDRMIQICYECGAERESKIDSRRRFSPRCVS